MSEANQLRSARIAGAITALFIGNVVCVLLLGAYGIFVGIFASVIMVRVLSNITKQFTQNPDLKLLSQSPSKRKRQG